MKPSSTVQLRMRGVMPRQLLSAAIATAPLVYVAFLTVVRHSPLVRPFTARTRDPMTLIPRLVRNATSRLKTLRVNQPGSR